MAVQCIHRADIRKPEHCWWCAGAGQEEASEPASAQRGADLDKAQTGVQNQPGPEVAAWQSPGTSSDMHCPLVIIYIVAL